MREGELGVGSKDKVIGLRGGEGRKGQVKGGKRRKGKVTRVRGEKGRPGDSGEGRGGEGRQGQVRGGNTSKQRDQGTSNQVENEPRLPGFVN